MSNTIGLYGSGCMCEGKERAVLERDYVATIAQRLREPRKFMQVVVGPRQTGKSTSVGQALDKLDVAKVEFSFDRPRDHRAQARGSVGERSGNALFPRRSGSIAR